MVVLDASIKDEAEDNKVLVKNIEEQNILFKFPDGFNNVDVFFEASALVEEENFDVMYALFMKYITGKKVQIFFKLDDQEVLLDEITVQTGTVNLNMFEIFVKYPVLLTWLIHFFKEHVKKKPMLLYEAAIEKMQKV